MKLKGEQKLIRCGVQDISHTYKQKSKKKYEKRGQEEIDSWANIYVENNKAP